jgi:hypothetical protein
VGLKATRISTQNEPERGFLLLNWCLDHLRMVINMDEAKLRTVAQLQEFLDATQEVTFTGAPGEGDQQRYEHISLVLKRLAYPGLSKGERGVVLAYLRCSQRLQPLPGHPLGRAAGV